MVVGEVSIHNIMGGMESTGGVRLHNHKRKLKQRFDIIKKLGQGTYGKVQLGINKETGQEVAIKTIKKGKIETEADLIRIRREIQIMSSVQHPNIIHIYEVFENKEKMVLVMEYAAGGELYDYLSERKVLSEEEARRIFRQISIAVYYCHKHKICHRDLKLENILLDHLGNAKIADFGLSNVFDENRFLNTFCGSPLYASPEIVKGTPYHGPEVDCWSLGVLLYTLVYGAMPFDGSNFKRLTKQISNSDYFEPKRPSPASPLIKDMLTKCPSRRADIERICSHWWVNEGHEQNCLDIAEDLAAQTPVRLDLLLSLVPQSASADELVVTNDQSSEAVRNISEETRAPTRCMSVGSLMEFDNYSGRLKEITDEEIRNGGNETKRKLEMTPSMEETVEAGVKKKDRSRRKERSDEREPRAYRSTSRHHSAPIANTITEEAMEINPAMEIDLRDPAAAAACLELIKEAQSKSPSKERTPAIPDESKGINSESIPSVNENINEVKPLANKLQDLSDKNISVDERSVNDVEKTPIKNKALKSKVKVTLQDGNAIKTDVPSKNNEVINEESKVNDKPSPTENAMEKKNDIKKLSQKQMSLDSEVPAILPTKPTERRRSKIFETAEKFNQLLSGTEPEKPKKIFIPGVNVGGAKKVFERKASLSSITSPQPTKSPASKVIIDVANDKKVEKTEDKSVVVKEESIKSEEERKREREKKRAVDIITGALGKPPMQKKLNGSPPPVTPQSPDSKNLGLKIQIGPNDVRNATVSVSTPVNTKYPNFEGAMAKPTAVANSVPTSPESKSMETSFADEPTMSSKMEITLKSATLPRPRKTSKAEITLAGIKSPEPAYKSEVEAKIDAFHPQKLKTQKSEVAFPVAAVITQEPRSSSLEPESLLKTVGKERIIPIHVEPGHQSQQSSTPPPSKPPMPQRSMSQRSSSLSRQSTADSDTDSALGSTVGPEPIRKSRREYIIPIAVEGGGYVTPRSGSVEPESKTSTPTSNNPARARFGRGRRIGSLLSDASEDESPFSTLHRDNDDLLQRHMHRLRSSRPTRQTSEHADSLSSGEDDDDDGFELLTAENLFSTLLSRVRSLTQRLNVDDNRGTGFPRSRLLDRLGTKSSQGFWGLHEPLSRRLSESPFTRSLSRDTDRFGRKDSAMSTNPGTPTSLGARTTPSRESIFEVGSSNTLPRDKNLQDETETDSRVKKETQETQVRLNTSNAHENFTPSLARRLSRQFIEQTRQSLPRSPSIPRDRFYRSSTEEPSESLTSSIIPERSEYRSKSSDRSLRRTNSLLDNNRSDRPDYRSTRRSVSLFDDDEDQLLPPLPRQIMTLGRKYRDPLKTLANGGIRRDICLTEKIQEEPSDELHSPKKVQENNNGNDQNQNQILSTEKPKCNSIANLNDLGATSSIKTSESPSTSNTKEDVLNSFRADAKDFENRLLAAENLIKESKKRNLNIDKFDPNLNSSYTDTDKCEKEFQGSITDLTSTALAKRRSCIPGLRLRSASLTRDVLNTDRRKSFAYSQNSNDLRDITPERSLLRKFFRAGSISRDIESKEKSPKAKRRISRFLRPDFFDTPREESQYVKEKEAQKAAENERRKSRFMKRKNQNKDTDTDNSKEEKPEKELKNEVNEMTRDQCEINTDNKINNNLENIPNGDVKIEQPNSNSFLQSLEKKLEKLQSGDESPKIHNLNTIDKETFDKDNSITPSESHSVEAQVLPKAASVEDLSLSEASTATSKSKVSSVLGLFKNDSKSAVNGTKQQNTLLSKFKKNIYKGSRSDTNVITGETSSNSKIPTKFRNEVKPDLKPCRRSIETKKSPDKNIEIKKSPPKEKAKEKSPLERLSLERKVLVDKPSKSPKKLSPEKTTESKPEKMEKSSVKDKSVEKELRKSGSPDKIENKNSTRLMSLKKASPDKVLDNKKNEIKSSESEEKKVLKTKEKKSVKSLNSLPKNGSVSKLEKTDESDKKVKKIIKKETLDKEGSDGTKKKKIVRVVKKVVKKSESSPDSNTEEKEKSSKTLLKKITSSVKKENSLENVRKKLEKNSESKQALVQDSNVVDVENKSGSESISINQSSTDNKDVTGPKQNDLSCVKSVPDSDNKLRNNRSNLKLDLSKIPQHTFKNTGTLKKSFDSLSKMTHHANITGNKIIIDKPLTAAYVNELKKQTSVQNSSEQQSAGASINDVKQDNASKFQECHAEMQKNIPDTDDKIKEKPKSNQEFLSVNSNAIPPPKITPDHTEDILSPIEDGESFDSWSICSNDINHRSSMDLYSPTSPAYSPSIRSDHSESIIDRIRRKSFYSRFNERKRKNSLTVPSTGAGMSSSTLPRKYSFHSTRDIDRKNIGFSKSPIRRNCERTHSLYNDDLSGFRKSPVDRDIYTEVGSSLGSFFNDLKSPGEHYGSTTSYYDSLRKYRTSTPDHTYRKYQSTDLNLDSDLDLYKRPLLSSSSALTDSISEYRSNLPRRFGSTVSDLEPKTAEYYEELLTPSRIDYLTPARKTPDIVEYIGKHENGHYNGHLELLQSGADKWRGLSEKRIGLNSPEESDKSHDDDRSSSQTTNESKELSAACPDADTATSIVE